jgi:hypothetical protein
MNVSPEANDELYKLLAEAMIAYQKVGLSENDKQAVLEKYTRQLWVWMEANANEYIEQAKKDRT